MLIKHLLHSSFALALLMLVSIIPVSAQENTDSLQIRKLYEEAMLRGRSYEHLEFLCTQIGARLSGSPQAAAAVEFTRQVLDSIGLDSVWLQPVMVPHWVRGPKEKGIILNSRQGQLEVPVCALGNSVGTGPAGVNAQVVEVKSFDELKALGRSKVEGKIVFFNQRMDPTRFNTFEAYGAASAQRGAGPSEAAKLGAVGVVVRSLASQIDDYPHTGSTSYQLNVPKIPAVAISTRGAEQLSSLLANEPNLRFYFETHCQQLPEVLSYNVIGEIRGSQKPEEIITVGGHLDSWDLGQGAHDDGAGCVQAIEVVRLFKKTGIQPKRTIRAVMFMNEENGLRGGREYARVAQELQEKHIAAIESDRGGFTPREFTAEASTPRIQWMARWQPLLAPYGIASIKRGGGGADIGPLRVMGTSLIGFGPDSQRYFDLHHTAADTFDKVNKRELELGAAVMAGLTYLLSEYGNGE